MPSTSHKRYVLFPHPERIPVVELDEIIFPACVTIRRAHLLYYTMCAAQVILLSACLVLVDERFYTITFLEEMVHHHSFLSTPGGRPPGFTYFCSIA